MKQEITIDEFKKILNFILDTNNQLTKQGKPKVTLELVGNHGIGKTECIRQVANERGMKLVKLNLAQTEELGD